MILTVRVPDSSILNYRPNGIQEVVVEDSRGWHWKAEVLETKSEELYADEKLAAAQPAPGKPVVCIGNSTINRLKNCETVELDTCSLIAASDLLDEGKPTLVNEIVDKVFQAVMQRLANEEINSQIDAIGRQEAKPEGLKVGDKVRLKTGGPWMTVEVIYTGLPNDYVLCAYFDGVKLVSPGFSPESLETEQEVITADWRARQAEIKRRHARLFAQIEQDLEIMKARAAPEERRKLENTS